MDEQKILNAIADLRSMNEDADELETKISRLEEDLDDSKSDLKDLQRTIEERRADLEDLIAEATGEKDESIESFGAGVFNSRY